MQIIDVERRSLGGLEVFEDLLIVSSVYPIDDIVYKVDLPCTLSQMHGDDDDDDEFESPASFD